MARTAATPLAIVVLLVAQLACGSSGSSEPDVTPTSTAAQGASVARLCLQVVQSFPQIPEGYSLPIAEAVQRILTGLGVEVVTPDLDCDATLSINLTFTGLSEFYSGLAGPAAYCYTGAKVEGQIVLDGPSRSVTTIPVSREEPSPTNAVLSYCPSEPIESPFGELWPSLVVDSLVELWGTQVLGPALGDDDPAIREVAGWALSRVGPLPASAVPALLEALEDPEGEVRGAAAYALGSIGYQDAEVVQSLINALGDEEWEVRPQAAWALGEIGDPSAVTALHQALADPSWIVQGTVAEALGKIGPSAAVAVPTLVELLATEELQLQEDVIVALGAIGSTEAVPGLIEVLRGDDPSAWYNRRIAAEALASITGQDFGEDASPWQQWWEAQR